MSDKKTEDGARYEYGSPDSFPKLEGENRLNFKVPISIVMDCEEDIRRLTAFSFFSVWRGFNSKVRYCTNDIMEWTHRKPNRNKNSASMRMVDAVKYLENEGYVSLSEEPKTSSSTVAEFSFDKVERKCDDEMFAILYVDEVEKILDYKDEYSADNLFSCDVLLLVFAYLRTFIKRRKNRMLAGETVESRRKGNPEAWECYYKDIADDIGVSERLVSKSVGALRDLGLIYSEEPAKTQRKNGDWRTEQSIFCNFYKREFNVEFASGESYYMREYTNKKNSMLRKSVMSRKKTKE